MAEKNALGKGFDGLGLDRLFESNTQKTQKDDVYQELALDSVTACSTQPRKYFSEDQLKELAASIQEKGIVQPIVVRPLEDGRYEIVAGERRYRAAKMLNLEKIPAVVRNYSESDAMTIALIENIQREDLNPIEEAEAYALLKDKYKLSQEELAKKLGKNRSTLANSLRLLNLPQNMRELVFQKKLSAAHGRTLLALHNEQLQVALAERILKYNLSVRDAENLAEYANAYQELPKDTSLTNLTENDQEAKNLEENSEITELSQEQNALENQDAKARRRVLPKSQFFTQLQKQLRKEVHRGTKLSGTIENGKLILPFSGQNELEHLLHLLSFEASFENVDTAIETTVEDVADIPSVAHVDAVENVLESANSLEIAEEHTSFIEENVADDFVEKEDVVVETLDTTEEIVEIEEVEELSLDDLDELEEEELEEIEELSLSDLDEYEELDDDLDDDLDDELDDALDNGTNLVDENFAENKDFAEDFAKDFEAVFDETFDKDDELAFYEARNREEKNGDNF